MAVEDPRPTLSSSQTLESIGALATASERVIDGLRNAVFDEEGIDGPVARTYTISEVSRMINRTPEGIRKAEKAGKLTPPAKRENGRREPYTLAQVNAMRELWDQRPGRAAGDQPIRLSFQNFKGGVGKSTLCCHCAQYFARAGYRVLLIDCDSQASTSMTFGVRPDEELADEATLLPYLQNEAEDIHYAIRPTHWDGLDLIPANLELYSAEYFLAANSGMPGQEDWLSRLSNGIESVEDAYDIIVIDPPPALGMIALSVLRSLDGLIIPTPPAIYDFHSTSSFFSMLVEVMESVGQALGEPVELDFVKVVLSKHTSGRQAHEFVSGLMAEAFGNNLLNAPFIASAEIDNAASLWQTVYDLGGATASRQTYKRCITALDEVFGEVESLVQAVWQNRRAERTLSGVAPEQEPSASAARQPSAQEESIEPS